MRGDFVERRYSDEELRRILEDATLSEQQHGSLSSGGEGHTLAAIREIAQEVGIDPAEVDRAAANLVASESIDRPSPAAGGFARVLHEELVIRRSLTNAEMRLVAVQAERVLGRRGTLRDSGDWVDWRDGKDRLYVGVVRGRDKTRIRVIADQSAELLTGSGVIGVMGLLSLQTASGLNTPAAVVVVAAIAGATFGLIKLYSRWRSNITRSNMQELLEILEDAVRPA